LALAALKIIVLPPSIIEFLIPLSILLTALYNIFQKEEKTTQWRWNYLLALFFGFIHGMGFSNFFSALLGKESHILGPLFAFNIGIELGQIGIIAVFLGLYFLIVDCFKLPQRFWAIGISCIAAVLASWILFNQF